MPGKKRAVWLFLLLLTSCIPDKPVEMVSVEALQATGIGKKSSFSVSLRLRNPNPFGCRVISTEADILINDQRIGHARLEKSFRMPADTQFVAVCQFDADIPAMARVLPGMLMDPKHIMATVNGQVVASIFMVRKKYPFTVKQRVDREFLQRLF